LKQIDTKTINLINKLNFNGGNKKWLKLRNEV